MRPDDGIRRRFHATRDLRAGLSAYAAIAETNDEANGDPMDQKKVRELLAKMVEDVLVAAWNFFEVDDDWGLRFGKKDAKVAAHNSEAIAATPTTATTAPVVARDDYYFDEPEPVRPVGKIQNGSNVNMVLMIRLVKSSTLILLRCLPSNLGRCCMCCLIRVAWTALGIASRRPRPCERYAFRIRGGLRPESGPNLIHALVRPFGVSVKV